MKRVYVNIDANTPTYPYMAKVFDQKFPFCEESLYPLVDAYKKTDVTDVLFNIFCQVSLPPSEYINDSLALQEYTDKYNIENGFARTIRFFYDLYTKYNIDPYDVWIKRCRKNGQNPWLSFRMNDSHHLTILFDENIETFSKTAKEKGWILGKDYGWFENCLDYRVPEVRNTLLSYIEEQLLRYDVYGIELDFMRDITCFKYITENMAECTEIMTDFMRKVREITQRVGKVHGHNIKICVRTMRDAEQASYYGQDLETWAKEGLIDILVPTPRFTGGDSGIPIKKWQKLVEGVEVIPGIELGVNYEKSRGFSVASPELAKGFCASFLSQGADGIYFYNYFLNPEEDSKYVTDEEHRIEHSVTRKTAILTDCSDLKTLYYSTPLRFAIIPQAAEGFAKPAPMWQPLPASLSSNEEGCFEITTGKLPEGNTVYLVIGADKSIENCTVTINGEECALWSDIDLRFMPGIGTQPCANVSGYTPNYVSDETICKRCIVNTNILTDLVQNIKIKSNSNEIKIEWIEIYTF